MAGTEVLYSFTGPNFFPVTISSSKSIQRTTLIELHGDGTCTAHFRVNERNIPTTWVKHGPLRLCFLKNDKRSQQIEWQTAFEIINKHVAQAYYVDADLPEIGLNFFTMPLSAMDYRRIVDRLNLSDAIEALLSINDIVTLKEFRPSHPAIKNYGTRRRIQKSLIDTTEQAFLLQNGAEILKNNERSLIESSRPEFDCSFSLPDGKEYSYSFKFGLTSDLGKRIAVLIGKNGSGKSQTLLQVARQALGSVDNDWRGNFTPSRVIGFYTGSRVSRTFPPQTIKRTLSGYRLFNVADETSISSASVIDTLLEMIASNSRIADSTRFEIFVLSIKHARKNQPISILHPTFGAIDVTSIYPYKTSSETVTFWNSSGEIIEERLTDFVDSIDRSKGVFGREPNDLSSGEEAYVRLSIFSSAYTENGSLLLLDEPEVFLHPQFIDCLMGSLQRLLELTGSVAIVATHSAYVVRCVQEQMVYILRVENKSGLEARVDVQQARMKTFGADVGLISLFVFGEDEMETTQKRALRYIEDFGEEMDFLRPLVSDDLFAKLANIDEEGR